MANESNEQKCEGRYKNGRRNKERRKKKEIEEKKVLPHYPSILSLKHHTLFQKESC